MKKVIRLIFLIVILAGLVIAWLVFGPGVHNPGKKFLYIKTGSTYSDVTDSLKQKGFVKNLLVFNNLAQLAKYKQNVKPGKYKIPDGLSLYRLIKMLRAGRQEPVNLVIIKLRTRDDLAKKIAANFETNLETATNFFDNNDSLASFGLDTNTVMTSVIPNTYTFTWTTPVQNIFKRLNTEAKKFWNDQRSEKATRLGLTPKEVYTLASIVEEETNKQSDKGKIASVYLNRISKGMRLAADPTIKFAMKNFELKRIYHNYLDFPSPYNTYTHSGLPPGPICTPSIKTIDAVLDAPTTSFLFFVARADFSGYSDFAETYAEHLVYAKAYQKALDSLTIRKQQTN